MLQTGPKYTFASLAEKYALPNTEDSVTNKKGSVKETVYVNLTVTYQQNI